MQIYALFFIHCKNHHSDSHTSHVIMTNTENSSLWYETVSTVGCIAVHGYNVGPFVKELIVPSPFKRVFYIKQENIVMYMNCKLPGWLALVIKEALASAQGEVCFFSWWNQSYFYFWQTLTTALSVCYSNSDSIHILYINTDKRLTTKWLKLSGTNISSPFSEPMKPKKFPTKTEVIYDRRCNWGHCIKNV